MKNIFPLLLCYVLMTSQSYALSGGPVFGSSATTTIGIYSGSFMGTTETEDPNAKNPVTVPTNAVGIFSLSVPKTGNASGSLLIFSNGTVFTGTITAVVDPVNGKLSGILAATYDFTVDVTSTSTIDNGDGTTTTTTTVTPTAVMATAAGSVTAKINTSTNNTNSAGRMTGTAALQLSYNVNEFTDQPNVTQVTNFNVTGFRQSNVASTASDVGTATGSTGGGSSN